MVEVDVPLFTNDAVTVPCPGLSCLAWSQWASRLPRTDHSLKLFVMSHQVAVIFSGSIQRRGCCLCMYPLKNSQPSLRSNENGEFVNQGKHRAEEIIKSLSWTKLFLVSCAWGIPLFSQLRWPQGALLRLKPCIYPLISVETSDSSQGWLLVNPSLQIHPSFYFWLVIPSHRGLL